MKGEGSDVSCWVYGLHYNSYTNAFWHLNLELKVFLKLCPEIGTSEHCVGIWQISQECHELLLLEELGRHSMSLVYLTSV